MTVVARHCLQCITRSVMSTIRQPIVMVGWISVVGFCASSAGPKGDSPPADPRGKGVAAADLVLLNGKVWTVNAKQPEATAVAIWRDRILAVGDDAAVRALAGQETRVVDLKGKRVLPGFHDSHVHILGAGLSLSRVDLKDAASEEEFGRRLQEFDRKLPRGRWLVGGNWDHDRTFGGKLPDAGLLDKYVKDRPVFLRRYDGHMALANSAALKLCGITADTKDPEGGAIDRKPDGKTPTGILRDKAMALVNQIPPPDEDEIAEAVLAALAEAKKVGVTSAEDMDGSDAATRRKLLRLYQKLARSGQLTCRVGLRWPLDEWKALADLGVAEGLGNDFVKIGGVKGFIDGSLGSSTAKMFEPYLNEPNSTGVFVTPPGRMKELVRQAHQAGLSVCVHAIGDRGNAVMLDIFADVAAESRQPDPRFRIEHAQHLRREDYGRFAKHGVIASMQPYHIIDDGRWAESRIGVDRCAASYACRGLLDAKARLAFGSDWPVAPLSPLLGIDAAVNRRTLDGKHPKGWHAEQKITVAEAIEAYTLSAAYAGRDEKNKGSIEPGKLADLVVLSRDILDPAERDNLTKAEVEITIVGGRIVWQKPAD